MCPGLADTAPGEGYSRGRGLHWGLVYGELQPGDLIHRDGMREQGKGLVLKGANGIHKISCACL